MSDGFVLKFSNLSHDANVMLEKVLNTESGLPMNRTRVHLVKPQTNMEQLARQGTPLCEADAIKHPNQFSKPMHLEDYNERYDGRRHGMGHGTKPWNSTKHSRCRSCETISSTFFRLRRSQ